MLASKENRGTNVKSGGNNVEDGLVAVGGGSTGLLDDVGHGEAFIENPQLAGGCVVCLGVEENAAVFDCPVDVGNH